MLSCSILRGAPTCNRPTESEPAAHHARAIHIYGGNFFEVPRSEWDTETLEERPFDIEAARRKFKEAAERFQGGR